ncbi:MAG: alpha/beta hydrolase [Armatimonadetes bacterium]|nr:alpha/beta hydrolase [Armatimonadota bacterium]
MIGDYPPGYPPLPQEWVEEVLAKSPQSRHHVVRALQRDSSLVMLHEDLRKILCPVLIWRGALSGSLMPAKAVDVYQQFLRKTKVVVFEDSGHELWKPDYERYIQTIKEFLENVDSVQPPL